MSDPRRRKLLWIRRLVLAAVLVALAYGTVLVIQAARRNARRQVRMIHLKQIGMAFECFGFAYDRLPPAVRVDEAGKPLSSWRFQLRPFVECCMIDVDFDKPWDDPVNHGIAEEYAGLFGRRSRGDSPTRFHTNIMAITGPGTAFDGQRECRLADLDGDTILVVEVADSGIHWMAPGDVSIDRVPESLAKGLDGEGVCVLFADGAVWFLRADVPLEDLKKFFTIEGAKRHDRDDLLGPHAGKRLLPLRK